MFYNSTEGKKERKKKDDIYLDLAREQKTVIHEGKVDTNCSKCAWNGLRWLGKETGGNDDHRKNRDHPDDVIVKIS